MTQKPLPSKRYYDVASWFTTHFVFAFVTVPFVILSFKDTVTIWSRMYFYGVIVTGASMAFFASPGKKWLRSALEKRDKEAGGRLSKSSSAESLTALAGKGQEPVLGIAADPGREVDEMVGELKREVERVKTDLERKRTGKGMTEKERKMDILTDYVNEMEEMLNGKEKAA